MTLRGGARSPNPEWAAWTSLERGRRGVQLALAGFWALDALLQFQPVNFTKAIVFGTILGNAEHQPQPIFGSLVIASRLLGPYAVEVNVAIIVVQLAIAAGLLWPRAVRPALGVSIVWALGVWWLGEGFGGDFAGKATMLVGWPGPALLYAVLAVIAWPSAGRGGATIAGVGALGDRASRDVWAILWIGGAILRVAPFWFPPVYALQEDFQLGLDAEPRWLFRVNESLSHFAATAGLPLVSGIGVLEAMIGIGVFTRYRRAFLAVGILVAGVYWAFGQQFAQLFTGGATDVGAGPLYVLLAITLWTRPAALAGSGPPWARRSRSGVLRGRDRRRGAQDLASSYARRGRSWSATVRRRAGRRRRPQEQYPKGIAYGKLVSARGHGGRRP